MYMPNTAPMSIAHVLTDFLIYEFVYEKVVAKHINKYFLKFLYDTLQRFINLIEVMFYFKISLITQF